MNKLLSKGKIVISNIGNFLEDIINNYIILAIPVWVFTLSLRAYFFHQNLRTDFTNSRDTVIYPFLITALFLLILFIGDRFFKLKETKIRKIGVKQVLLLNIYFFTFVTKIDIYTIFFCHGIVAVSLLVNDLINKGKYDNKLFLVLLAVGSLLLLFYNTTPIIGDASLNENGYIIEEFSERHSYNSAVYYNRNTEAIKDYYLLPLLNYKGAPFQDPGEPPESPAVYTHYPAGADFIHLGLVKAMGEDNTLTRNKYRVFPFAIYIVGFVALSLFYKKVTKSPVFSVTLALLTVLTPAIDKYKLSLYYYSYAFSLLFVFFYLLYLYFESYKKRYLLLLGLIGFIQVWFSFDLLHILIGFAFAFMFLPISKNFSKFTINNLKPTAVVILGVVLGMLSRFMHNALYFKSLSATYADFKAAFLWRTSGTFGIEPYQLYIDTLLKRYNDEYIYNKDFFGYPLLFLTFVILVVVTFILFQLKKNKKLKVGELEKMRSITLFLWLGVLISYAWMYLFRNHGAIHPFFLVRHFIFALISLIVFVAYFSESIKKLIKKI